jgi:hypothetical protein
MGQNRVINGEMKAMTADRETASQAAPGGWTQHVVTQMVEMHRSGWLGAWDAFVSALLRKPRLSVAQPMTLSAWIKAPKGKAPVLSITQMQVETHQ